MAVVLLAIMLAGLLIIATEPLNHISKAAVAMFAGVCCWLLYIAQGNNFVSSQHAADYAIYLADNSLQVHERPYKRKTIKTHTGICHSNIYGKYTPAHIQYS